MGIHISIIKPVMVAYKSNSPEFPDSSHSEDRLGGLFSYIRQANLTHSDSA